MHPARSPIAAAALLALALPALRQEEPAPRQQEPARFELLLPDGDAAKAWAGVGPETAPAALPTLDAGQGPPELARWVAWGRWVPMAADGGEHAPEARSGLACLAVASGRWADAWRAFARLGGTPARAAALAPHLLPGVPLEHAALAGGAPPALADGVVLRPALPPSDEADPPGGVVPRRATARGFRVGAALLELEVFVEPAGVQVDLRHLGGGPARLFVVLPESPGEEIRVEYVDWFRQDTLRQPLLVELLPGTEPVTLFGRFLPREAALPRAPEGELPRGLARGGLWIELGARAGDPALARAAAEALGRALGLPARLRGPLDPPPAGPWSGIVLRYAEPAEGARLLDAVASAVEARLLE